MRLVKFEDDTFVDLAKLLDAAVRATGLQSVHMASKILTVLDASEVISNEEVKDE